MSSKFLFRNFSSTVHKTYIITVEGNSVSQDLGNRCMESCLDVKQDAEFWKGFDGTGKDLIIPKHLENQSWYKWLKVFDHYQSLAEIATSLSHISLWVKCMELDQPIVVLEHDAIMVKQFKEHKTLNTVHYLGCKDFMLDSTKASNKFFSSINKNWLFINRAHAYSIDPIAAKRLFTTVLDRGIFESADVMMMLENVAIVYDDLYAYDEPGETIIKTRKK